MFPLFHDTSLPLVLAGCGACLSGVLIVSCARTRRRMQFLLSGIGGLLVAVAIGASGRCLRDLSTPSALSGSSGCLSRMHWSQL